MERQPESDLEKKSNKPSKPSLSANIADTAATLGGLYIIGSAANDAISDENRMISSAFYIAAGALLIAGTWGCRYYDKIKGYSR